MTGDNCDQNSEQHSTNKWRNHRPTKLTIAIAGLFIYGFFVFIDAHEIWPSWPVIAVSIGVPVTVAVLYLEAFATEAISFDTFLVGSGFILVAGLLIYFFAPRNAPVEKPATPIVVVVPPTSPLVSPGASRTFQGGPGIPFEDTEVRGALKPANAPTPPNGCDGGPSLGPDALKILIGDNAITHNGFGKFTAVRIKACDTITMERRPDGIFVDASLFDPQGQAVVTINDNRIMALNGDNYTARQASDESTIRVRNRAGTELFYVAFLNPTTIQVRGFLGCAGGPIIHVTDNGPIPGTVMRGNCFANAQGAIQIGRP